MRTHDNKIIFCHHYRIYSLIEMLGISFRALSRTRKNIMDHFNQFSCIKILIKNSHHKQIQKTSVTFSKRLVCGLANASDKNCTLYYAYHKWFAFFPTRVTLILGFLWLDTLYPVVRGFPLRNHLPRSPLP